MTSSRIIVIGGPTASGKTALAVELARLLHWEVVSADSRQLYQEMQIGTARPLEDELQGVKHHLLGSHSITAHIGAGQYADLARPIVKHLLTRDNGVIIVGGTGLYIKALLEGLDEMPAISQSLRTIIKSKYESRGLNWLQEEVSKLDPVSYQSMDTQNPARLMRTLELCIASGQPASSLRQKPKELPFPDAKILGFYPDYQRDVLYQRIKTRTEAMFSNGLVDEVSGLRPYQSLNALQTVGYKEVFAYLDGQMNLAECKALVAQNTRNYAKRQLTWFRNQGHYQVLPQPTEAVNQIMAALEHAK